jgi:hypothetical protein
MTQEDVTKLHQERRAEHEKTKRELIKLHNEIEARLAALKAEFHAGNIAIEARKDRTGDHIKRDAYNLQRVIKKRLQEWKNEQLDAEQVSVQFETDDNGIHITAIIPLK